ncbi:MAG TPA: HlyD family secretion protein [Acidisarcina sp.]
MIPIVVLAAACGLFVAIRFGWPVWGADAQSQQTDDAYVRADQTPLSTRISGTVRRVTIGDYQPVHAGELLVELDDSDYQAIVAEAKAALEGAKAEYAANQNAKQVADAGINAARQGVIAAQSVATAAQAAIDAVRADVTHAESEFLRQQTLLSKRAATRQQFESAQAARDSSSAALAGRQAELLRADAAIASSQSAQIEAMQQRAALNSKDDLLRAQIEAKKAAITVAQVNLGYTRIYSPSNGAVGEFRVHPGQLVGAGIQVVDLVQSGVWVQANYRETQLGKVQPGDKADVYIDALPAYHFHGQVTEISPASGSQFALLPPDNATGNYTKIVQRVPVRIRLDSTEAVSQLRPGFSAVVTIHTSDRAKSDSGTAVSTEAR